MKSGTKRPKNTKYDSTESNITSPIQHFSSHNQVQHGKYLFLSTPEQKHYLVVRPIHVNKLVSILEYCKWDLTTLFDRRMDRGIWDSAIKIDPNSKLIAFLLYVFVGTDSQYYDSWHPALHRPQENDMARVKRWCNQTNFALTISTKYVNVISTICGGTKTDTRNQLEAVVKNNKQKHKHNTTADPTGLHEQ